jgi:Family of unknown function (DUF6152)
MRFHRLLAGAILCVIPALAHHYVTVDFDVSKTVKISGAISQVQFSNPHVTFALDAKNPDGTMTRWNVEFSAPNPLIRGGIDRDALKEGTIVTMEAYPAKDGTPKASGFAMTLPDGYRFAHGGPGQNNCTGPNCIWNEWQPLTQK